MQSYDPFKYFTPAYEGTISDFTHKTFTVYCPYAVLTFILQFSVIPIIQKTNPPPPIM